jgi:hypothetical protein
MSPSNSNLAPAAPQRLASIAVPPCHGLARLHLAGPPRTTAVPTCVSRRTINTREHPSPAGRPGQPHDGPHPCPPPPPSPPPPLRHSLHCPPARVGRLVTALHGPTCRRPNCSPARARHRARPGDADSDPARGAPRTGSGPAPLRGLNGQH